MTKTKEKAKSNSSHSRIRQLINLKNELAKKGKATADDRKQIRRQLRKLGYYISRPATHSLA